MGREKGRGKKFVDGEEGEEGYMKGRKGRKKREKRERFRSSTSDFPALRIWYLTSFLRILSHNAF